MDRHDDTIPVPATLRAFMRLGEEARRLRALGGLVGFLLAFYVPWSGGLGVAVALEHAIVGGIVGWFVSWVLLLTVAWSLRRDAVKDLRKALQEHEQAGERS